MRAGGGEDEVACGDQAFFVGKADGLAGADGGVGGLEARDADDGGDDKVDLGKGGDADSALGARDDLGGRVQPAARRRVVQRGGELFPWRWT